MKTYYTDTRNPTIQRHEMLTNGPNTCNFFKGLIIKVSIWLPFGTLESFWFLQIPECSSIKRKQSKQKIFQCNCNCVYSWKPLYCYFLNNMLLYFFISNKAARTEQAHWSPLNHSCYENGLYNEHGSTNCVSISPSVWDQLLLCH